MVTNEEAKAIADTHVTLLSGNEPVEDLLKMISEVMPKFEDSPEAFLEWIRTLTAPAQDPSAALSGDQKTLYRDRMQKLNGLLAKDEGFCNTIAAYHKWKNAQTPPEDTTP